MDASCPRGRVCDSQSSGGSFCVACNLATRMPAIGAHLQGACVRTDTHTWSPRPAACEPSVLSVSRWPRRPHPGPGPHAPAQVWVACLVFHIQAPRPLPRQPQVLVIREVPQRRGEVQLLGRQARPEPEQAHCGRGCGAVAQQVRQARRQRPLEPRQRPLRPWRTIMNLGCDRGSQVFRLLWQQGKPHVYGAVLSTLLRFVWASGHSVVL